MAQPYKPRKRAKLATNPSNLENSRTPDSSDSDTAENGRGPVARHKSQAAKATASGGSTSITANISGSAWGAVGVVLVFGIVVVVVIAGKNPRPRRDNQAIDSTTQTDNVRGPAIVTSVPIAPVQNMSHVKQLRMEPPEQHSITDEPSTAVAQPIQSQEVPRVRSGLTTRGGSIEHTQHPPNSVEYPAELDEWQSRLESLDLRAPIKSLDWIHSPSLKHLSVCADADTALALPDAAACPSLKSLALFWNGPADGIWDLSSLAQFTELTQLSISSRGKKVRTNFYPIGQLAKLRELNLLLLNGQVSDRLSFETLSDLTSVTLSHSPEDAGDYNYLKTLKNVRDLSLNVQSSVLLDTAKFAVLPNLSSLSLDWSNTALKDLSPLAHLPQSLTSFTLHSSQTMVTVHRPLQMLPASLTELTIDVSDSLVTDLTFLKSLPPNLQRFTLDVHESKIADISGLEELPAGVTSLHLDTSCSDVAELPAASKFPVGLREFVADVHECELKDVSTIDDLYRRGVRVAVHVLVENSDAEQLHQLTGAHELTLTIKANPIPDLSILETFSDLEKLTINLAEPSISDLSPLTTLPKKRLKEIVLSMHNTFVHDLTPLTKLPQTTKSLTLDFSNTQTQNVSPLAALASNLTELTLNLSAAGVSDLSPIAHLTRLESLTIEGATDGARKSLHGLPPRVRHLAF